MLKKGIFGVQNVTTGANQKITSIDVYSDFSLTNTEFIGNIIIFF